MIGTLVHTEEKKKKINVATTIKAQFELSCPIQSNVVDQQNTECFTV